MDTNGRINLCEDYVSFETAKLLKEKGFDEICLRTYFNDGIMSRIFTENEEICNRNLLPSIVSAPTLQMAMKWLREVHKLHIAVNMGFDVDNSQYFFYVPSICRFSNKGGEYQTPFGEKEFGSYEQACEAAIKFCLENLV